MIDYRSFYADPNGFMKTHRGESDFLDSFCLLLLINDPILDTKPKKLFSSMFYYNFIIFAI